MQPLELTGLQPRYSRRNRDNIMDAIELAELVFKKPQNELEQAPAYKVVLNEETAARNEKTRLLRQARLAAARGEQRVL